MVNALTYIPLTSGLCLLGLALWALFIPSFKFWPPPEKRCWQSRVFIILFRTMVYGTIFVSGWHVLSSGFIVSSWKATSATVLLFLGFALAFWATFGLGWKAAFGAKEGLRTKGAFAASRNPIYVATWSGLAGWGLLIPNVAVQSALFCWASLYLIAIFLEERWLRRQYGEEFEQYCEKVRRFL